MQHIKKPCHTDIINAIAKRFDYKNYLEIGVCNPNDCLNRIICPNKTGVDPAPVHQYNVINKTSDDFFSNNINTYDLIFIDGLHEGEQVFRDINNSLKFLNTGGTIIAHDCLPENPNPLIGTCYEAIMKLRQTRDDLEIVTLDTCTGIAIIRRGKSTIFSFQEEISFDTYIKYRLKSMNIVNTFDWFNAIGMQLDGFESWTGINKCYKNGREQWKN